MAELNLINYLTTSAKDASNVSKNTFMDKAFSNFDKIFDNINNKLTSNGVAKEYIKSNSESNLKSYTKESDMQAANTKSTQPAVQKDVHPSEKRDEVKSTSNDVKETSNRKEEPKKQITEDSVKDETPKTSEGNKQVDETAEKLENKTSKDETEIKDNKKGSENKNEKAADKKQEPQKQEEVNSDNKNTEKADTKELKTEVKVDAVQASEVILKNTDTAEDLHADTVQTESEPIAQVTEKDTTTSDKIQTATDEKLQTQVKVATEKLPILSQEQSSEQTKVQPEVHTQNTLQQTHEQAKKLVAESFSELALKAEISEVNVDVTETAQPQTETAAQAKTASAKVQPQTEQLKINLQTESVPQKIETQPTESAKITATTETPVIQVSEKVLTEAAAINTSNKKTSTLDILEKANLNQSVIDKLDAKVVSLQSSNTSSNLLSQQNASEQSIKIAFENSNQLVNNDSTKTSFAKTLESVQQPKELSKTDIMSQINSKLQTMKNEGTTKMVMTLRPENLGRIQLELVNGRDGLSARMVAENNQVKELLDKSLDSLRNSLGAQGLNVNNVSVKTVASQSSNEETLNPDGHAKDNSQQHSKDSDAGEEQKDFEQEFSSRFAQNKDEQEEKELAQV